jgi:hypothetical protein
MSCVLYPDAERRRAVRTRVEALARWEQRIVRALRRGDWDLAACSEECAAIIVHEIGLLQDGRIELVGIHRARPRPTQRCRPLHMNAPAPVLSNAR